ncbi:MAG TPA: hypothetical protein VJ572_09650, partial [Azonexus sp.]|nr:hypothetical protein [Azonexus sp.]
ASRHLGVAILFDPATDISRDDYEALEEVVDTFEGRRTCDRFSLAGNPTCHLVAENNLSNIRRLVAAGTSRSSMTLQAHEGDLIRIFGQELKLPRRELRMDGVSPKIQQDIGTIKDGDSVLVEWVPTDEFVLSYRFMDKDDGPPTELPKTGYP